MNLLTESAFLKALGWSLLDSLWQMGLLYIVYILLTVNGKRHKARQRHTIALLSLAGGSVWFIASLIMHFYEALSATPATSAFSLYHAAWFDRMTQHTEPALPYLSSLYLAVAAFLFIRFYYQYRHTQRLFTTGLHKAQPALRVFLQRMTGQMSIKKEVKIWFSELVDTPLTLGFLKPVILLPVAAMNHLTLQQTEAILLHELNHIKQHDYLINLLIACTDIIFFFNPFSRLLTDAIKKERENSCDDMVLQFRYDARSYAAALLALERNRHSSPALAVAATGKNRQLLLNRVQRILQQPVAGSPSYRLIAYLLVGLLAGWIGLSNPGEAIAETLSAVKDMLPASTSEAPIVYYTVSHTPEIRLAAAKPKAAATSKGKACPLNKPAVAPGMSEWVSAQEDEQGDDGDDENSSMASFATATETRDFTIPETEAINSVVAATDAFPYVPSTSFTYLIVEDTALPKPYMPSQNELKARESMEKTLKALNEIDWQKVQKGLAANGKKVDLTRLQLELKKALADVDWNKINEQVESLEQAQGQMLCDQQAHSEKMKSYQQTRKAYQAKQQKLQQIIVDQRLSEIQPLKDLDGDKKQVDVQKTKKKKIVTI